MKYDVLIWLHDLGDTEPQLFLLEYSSDGLVPRMIEVYRSRRAVLKVPAPGQNSVVSTHYPGDGEDDFECLRFEIRKSAFEKVLSWVTSEELM